LVRIEMEPSLAALCLRAAVPGDTERLQATAGEPDQVLLQGSNAECVLDLVVMQRAVRSVGMHEKGAGASKKPGHDPIVCEAHVLEVTQNGRLRGRLHRELMMRAGPQLKLTGMTGGANAGAGEFHGGSGIRDRWLGRLSEAICPS